MEGKGEIILNAFLRPAHGEHFLLNIIDFPPVTATQYGLGFSYM